MAKSVELLQAGLEKVFSAAYQSAGTALVAQQERTDSDPDRKERLAFWGDRISFLETLAERVKVETGLDIVLTKPIPPETTRQEPK